MGGNWLSWEARLVRIKAQIYLAAPKEDKETGGGGDKENQIFFVPLSPCLPLSLSSSLLGHTYRGLRVLKTLSHCKSARQVFDQIIDIFDADREAYKIGGRRESVPQRLRYAGVRHPAGQADGRADRTEANRDVEKPCSFNHLPRNRHGAGRETDDRAIAGGLTAMDAVAWMVGETWIIDPDDLRATREVFDDLPCRFVLTLNAQGECLHPTQQQPGVERAQSSALRVLIEGYPAMQVIVICDQRPGGHVAVAAEEFCGRMNDDVRAESERFLKAWREHRVVNCEQRPGLARDAGQRANVGDAHRRIRRGLDQNQFDARVQSLANGLHVGRVNVAYADSMPRQNLIEQPHRAAIKVVARDDLFARSEEPCQRADGCHSAREGAARFGAFEPRNLPLDQRARRIAAARIIVFAELVRRGLAKGGRLIDRRRDRTVRIVIRIEMHTLSSCLHC